MSTETNFPLNFSWKTKKATATGTGTETGTGWRKSAAEKFVAHVHQSKP